CDRSRRSQTTEHVRFAPKATVGNQTVNPPLCATSGLMQCSKIRSFDNIIKTGCDGEFDAVLGATGVDDFNHSVISAIDSLEFDQTKVLPSNDGMNLLCWPRCPSPGCRTLRPWLTSIG